MRKMWERMWFMLWNGFLKGQIRGRILRDKWSEFGFLSALGALEALVTQHLTLLTDKGTKPLKRVWLLSHITICHSVQRLHNRSQELWLKSTWEYGLYAKWVKAVVTLTVMMNRESTHSHIHCFVPGCKREYFCCKVGHFNVESAPFRIQPELDELFLDTSTISFK